MKEYGCFIQITLNNRKVYLTAQDGGGKGDNRQNTHYSFHTDAVHLGPWEEFELCPSGTGGFRLKTCWGNYMCFRMDKKVNECTSPLRTYSAVADEWQYFKLCFLDNGKVALKTYNGNYVTAVPLNGDIESNPVGTAFGVDTFFISLCDNEVFSNAQNRYLYNIIYKYKQTESDGEKGLYVALFGKKRMLALSDSEYESCYKDKVEDLGDMDTVIMKLLRESHPISSEMKDMLEKGEYYKESEHNIIFLYIRYAERLTDVCSLQKISCVENVNALELFQLQIPVDEIEYISEFILEDMKEKYTQYPEFEDYVNSFLGVAPEEENEEDDGITVSECAKSGKLLMETESADEYTLTAGEEMTDLMGESPVKLTSEMSNWIKAFFPIPKEYTILWADINKANSDPSGLVITKEAFCYKAGKEAVRIHNENNKDNPVTEMYFLIRWENFYQRGFSVKQENGKYSLFLDGEKILESCSSNVGRFFEQYDQHINNMRGNQLGGQSFTHMSSAVSTVTHVKNPKTGKGFLAEDAEMMREWIKGNYVVHSGTNNKKDGSDLIIGSREVQVKFYKDDRQLFRQVLDSRKKLRYIDSQGNPMELRVPKGKGGALIEKLDNLFPNGVNGHTAREYVTESKYTWEQMENVCKALTWDSIMYDAATAMINCAYPFTITFLVSYALQYSETGDSKKSFEAALASTTEGNLISIISYIVSMQLARTKSVNQVIHNSKIGTSVSSSMGRMLTRAYKTIQRTNGQPVALTQKTVCNNINKAASFSFIYAVSAWFISCAWDARKLAANKCSAGNYLKKVACTSASMVSSGVSVCAVASMFSCATGAFVPVIGNIVGFAVGSLVGWGTDYLVRKGIEFSIEDDFVVTKRMVDAILSDLIYEYSMDSCMLKKLGSHIKEIDMNGFIEEVFQAEKQEECIRKKFKPVMDQIMKEAVECVPEPNLTEMEELLEEA